MPYITKKVDGGWDVYKEDTGEKVGHVDGSKEDLNDYLAALHANEKKESEEAVPAEKQLSMEQMRSQVHAILREALTTRDEENNVTERHYFSIEETYPDCAIIKMDGVDGTYYKVSFTTENDVLKVTDIIPVVKKFVPFSEKEKKDFFEKVKEFFLGSKKKEDDLEVGFSIRKNKSGGYRWVSISATAHRDKDREIISTKALEKDVERADKEGDYGYLNWWHVPELIIGNCDFRALEGRMLIESGTIFYEEVAEALSEKEHRMSIEFYHPTDEPDSDGVYHHIMCTGRAILPAGAEANPFTVSSIKGAKKVNDKKLNEFVDLLGGDDEAKDFAKSIIEKSTAIQEEADAVADFKEAKEDEEQPIETEEEAVEEKEFDVEAFTEQIGEIVQTAVKEAVDSEMEAFKKDYQEAAQIREDELKETIKEMSKKIKTIQDDMPAVAKQYIASEDDETLIGEDDSLLESTAKESQDSVTDLMETLGILPRD